MKHIAFSLLMLLLFFSADGIETVEKWDFLEIELEGPSTGNPYKEVYLQALFTIGDSTSFDIKGFYNGNGIYKIRFMPNIEGEWTYRITSNAQSLNSKTGHFTCLSPASENHGPVYVANTSHFAYADGTPYKPFGTTSYAWIFQGEVLEEQTIETLSSSPFNKIRMCLFPKNDSLSENNPEFFPFQIVLDDSISFDKFNPDYWKNLEQSI